MMNANGGSLGEILGLTQSSFERPSSLDDGQVRWHQSNVSKLGEKHPEGWKFFEKGPEEARWYLITSTEDLIAVAEQIATGQLPYDVSLAVPPGMRSFSTVGGCRSMRRAMW